MSLADTFFEEVKRSFLLPDDKREQYFAVLGVALSDSLQFNASVGLTDQDFPQYTFNQGMALGISDACMALACNLEFCAWHGLDDCHIVQFESKIDSPQRYFDYSYAVMPDGTFRMPYQESLAGPNVDECGRGRLGNHLSEIAIKFVSLHEQGHFLGGHLHYLRSRRGGSRWLEIPGAGQGDLAPEERCALELDADAIAAVLAVGQFIRFPEMRKMTGRGLWLKDAYTDEGWLFYALLGVCLVFAIFDRAERVAGRPTGATRSHPSAAARLLSLMDVMRSLILDTLGTEGAEKLISAWLHESQIMFAQLNCNPLSIEAFNEYFDPDTTVYQTAVAQELERLRPTRELLVPPLGKMRETILTDFGAALARLEP